MSKNAIVVGASSGIGRALAHELAADGYRLGLAARRVERLEVLGRELPTKSYVARIDVAEPEEAMDRLRRLIDAMGEVDLAVISSGVGFLNRDLEWGPERDTVDVNVRGFAAMANVALEHFDERGTGHLVGVSSVAHRFGNPGGPAYNASKAFVSNYLEGLRYRAELGEGDVTITTIEPGFVDTEMAIGDDLFWMASPETAAAQIARAIRRERKHAYVTRRWRLVARLIDLLPDAARRRVFT